MERQASPCKLLTNHAHVLLYLQAHPRDPLRKVALALGVTERAVQLIVADLEAAGYLTRQKVGRQNQYELHGDAPLQHTLEANHCVQDLLDWAASKDSEDLDDEKALHNWTVGEHGSEV